MLTVILGTLATLFAIILGVAFYFDPWFKKIKYATGMLHQGYKVMGPDKTRKMGQLLGGLDADKIKGLFSSFTETKPVFPQATQLGQSLCITYRFQDRDYNLILPFNPTEENKKVYLHTKDNRRVDITHQNGISYYASAQEMGGVSLEIYDVESDSSEFCGKILAN